MDGIPRVVVVGIDGSASGTAAAAWAHDLAASTGASLRLVAVHDPTVTSVEHVEGVLRAAHPSHGGVAVEIVVAEGQPVDALLIQSEDAELLVVGRHGTTGLIHSARGGVGERCARLARCPVVIVPPTYVGGSGGHGPGDAGPAA